MTKRLNATAKAASLASSAAQGTADTPSHSR